jgi:cell division septal protein FtsQ
VQSPRSSNESRRPNRLARFLRSGVLFWSIFAAVVVFVIWLMTRLV